MAELDIEKVKARQRKKKEPENPIVDEQTNDKDGNKREYDVESEEYIEGDSYPIDEAEKQKKPREKREPQPSLPFE